MYSRLLVPLDGSRLAESVLPVVERLATAEGAFVILLHVIERGAPVAVHGDRHLTHVTEADPYLEGLADRIRDVGISVQTHAHPAPEGDVARSIVDHSDEQQADLIVLCTHGRGKMRDLLFGRIAQQVLRRGTTPVLLRGLLPLLLLVSVAIASLFAPLLDLPLVDVPLPVLAMIRGPPLLGIAIGCGRTGSAGSW